MSDTKTVGFQANANDLALIDRIVAQQKKKYGVELSVSVILRLALRAFANKEGLK